MDKTQTDTCSLGYGQAAMMQSKQTTPMEHLNSIENHLISINISLAEIIQKTVGFWPEAGDGPVPNLTISSDNLLENAANIRSKIAETAERIAQLNNRL